jgi:hypothetical protein
MSAEQVQYSMEQEVVRMVLQAKRLFAVEIINPRDTLRQYNITKEEIYFWFNTFYESQLGTFKDTIESLS